MLIAVITFSHGVFSGDTYSALVMVVLLTTVLGPLLLKQRLDRF